MPWIRALTCAALACSSSLAFAEPPQPAPAVQVDRLAGLPDFVDGVVAGQIASRQVAGAVVTWFASLLMQRIGRRGGARGRRSAAHRARGVAALHRRGIGGEWPGRGGVASFHRGARDEARHPAAHAPDHRTRDRCASPQGAIALARGQGLSAGAEAHRGRELGPDRKRRNVRTSRKPPARSSGSA